MPSRMALAKCINNGQSEAWIEAEIDMRRIVATKGIVYPVRLILINADVAGNALGFAHNRQLTHRTVRK
jgi:hypothetical protein